MDLYLAGAVLFGLLLYLEQRSRRRDRARQAEQARLEQLRQAWLDREWQSIVDEHQTRILEAKAGLRSWDSVDECLH